MVAVHLPAAAVLRPPCVPVHPQMYDRMLMTPPFATSDDAGPFSVRSCRHAPGSYLQMHQVCLGGAFANVLIDVRLCNGSHGRRRHQRSDCMIGLGSVDAATPISTCCERTVTGT
jgi:hypothetical protein